MRRLLAAVLPIFVVSPVFAGPELTCALEIACPHTDPCRGHEKDSPSLVQISGDGHGGLIAEFGHRTATFDRVVTLENNAIFAHSIDTNNGRQEMLSLVPPGNLMLSTHNNLDIGVSITAFGVCNRTD